MLSVFDEVNTLDKKCYEKYFLSEDILMEHAALAIANYINNTFEKNKKILIVCGSGNNGADGLVLARLLFKTHKVKLYILNEPKTKIAILQKKRTSSLGVEQANKLNDDDTFDIVVDCLFGSGLNRTLNNSADELIKLMNTIQAYKISCDIPSGINSEGQILSCAFKADTTITMGALKKSLFGDLIKDYIGNIILADLGIHNSLYENKTSCFLLEEEDLILPLRKEKNTNKGTFGHLSVVLGEKKGAGLIACQSALSFGVGLVTAITEDTNIPYSFMYSKELPSKTTALALGMGLGKFFDDGVLDYNLPMLIDADLFYNEKIIDILKKDNIVLTPHPKEFCKLLKISSIADININELQNNRFKYLNDFCKIYPNIVVLLKGANVLIQKNEEVYINSLGTSKLSFGGSGDILAGLIASLLAQGYEPIKAAIQGSLAHTIAANNFKGNDFALDVNDLIEEIKIL